MAQSRFKLKFWRRMIFGISLGLGLALVVHQFELQTHLQAGLQTGLLRVQQLGKTGVLLFIVLYNLATLLFIPSVFLTLGAGVLYGVFWGSVYVMVAATLGAILAFGLGRYVARDWVCRRMQRHPQFQAIDRAVAEQGLKIVLLTRLSPLFPFNLLNYTFGITCISFQDYALGSLGMIPGTVMYVYLGALVGDLASLGMQELPPQAQMVRWMAKIIGFLITMGVSLYLARLAQIALNPSLTSQGTTHDPFD